MNNKTKEPLILTSAEPINDGGRKYNLIYWICAIGLGITFLCMAGLPACLFGILLGLCVGWLIKNKILNTIDIKLRRIPFAIKNKVEYSELINRLLPVLAPYNMMIEKSAEKGGFPVITYQGIIYDVFYNDDDTFTIWWRKSIGKALLEFDSIGKYRKVSCAMGIIGYNIQKVCDGNPSEVNTSTTATVNETVKEESAETSAATTVKKCPTCGADILDGSVFCHGCGNKLPEEKKCPACGAVLTEDAAFCHECGQAI